MNRLIKISVILILAIATTVYYTSCEKEPTPPSVTTTGVSAITQTTATSGGNVTGDGGAKVSARGVCWSTSPNPTIGNNKTTDGTGTGIFTSNLTGLQPDTKYYVRAYATNSEGTSYGNEVSFTTGEILVPTLTTTAVSAITYTSASSGGNITDNGGGDITARGVCWSTSTNPTTADSKTEDGTGTGTFTSNLTGLSPNTTYYVRAYATNSAGTAYGNEVSFTTSTLQVPTLTTTAASSITLTTAISGGNITDDGGDPVTARGVCWSTSTNPTTANNSTTDGAGTGVFTSNLSGLVPNTTYYVRAYATNSVGTAYGNEVSFTTQPIQLATLTTTAVTSISLRTATSGGNITDDGGGAITARGVCWSTSTNPTTADFSTSDGTGTGVFTSNLTGLSPSTTYYVRAYAINSAGTSYGNEVSFTTQAIQLPTLTTSAITSITLTSAVSGGTITNDGGGNITARGVCWSTSQNPTTANNTTSNGTGTGLFISNLTGLSPNTTYYVRAYATNSAGTAYGNQLSFTTLNIQLPTLTTTAASAITRTSATSGGTITDDGGGNISVKGVCWSTSANPTTADNTTNDGTGSASFTSSLTGLSPGTTYHVRAYATNEAGTSYGNDISFTTDPIVIPTLTTTAASAITQTSATSGGNITDAGGGTVSARGVCWSTSTNPTTADNTTSNGTGTGTFTSSITGLTPGTTYYVRAYATNSAGTAYGNQVTFDTDPVLLPTLTTTAASAITRTSASSGGNITDNGGGTVSARGVCWSTSTNPTTADNTTSNGTGTGSFTSNLTGLTAGTTYYIRAYATNEAGTAYGNQVSFETDPVVVPTLTTTAVSAITQTSASSGGNITDDGGGPVTARGVCWSTSTNPTTADNTTSDGTGTGIFTSSLAGLTPGTTYYVRAYATNSAGTAYGNQVSFDTDPIALPTLSTNSVSSITPTTAVSGGNITDDGGGTITARGVCWSTSTNPTTADNTTSDGTGTGIFTSNLSGLTPGTTYYVRAYAINIAGTAYGNQVSFETDDVDIPTVSTEVPYSITQTTAMSGGNVSSDGGSPVTARGVCWSISSNPTIADNHTDDGTGTGAFGSSITGLNTNTFYYVRAYATNAVGTAYGNQQTLTTQQLIDADGNVYRTVVMGSQVWMAENLKVLPSVHATSDNSDTDPRYYVYGYDGTDVPTARATENFTEYGVLYNWPAAVNACPTGWHMPTDSEWKTMEIYIGMPADTADLADVYRGVTFGNGDELKETGTSHWNSNNGTDLHEFTALPAGLYSYYLTSFLLINDNAYFWTATSFDADNSWKRFLDDINPGIHRNHETKAMGYSVRCIKD